MKYMGHKGKMLATIEMAMTPYLGKACSIADPFCGSGVVSWYFATHFEKRVIAGDLQAYAAIRAASVVERTSVKTIDAALYSWFTRAKEIIAEFSSYFPLGSHCLEPTFSSKLTAEGVARCRKFCEYVVPMICKEELSGLGMLSAYGGYYFSPIQALIFDSLRQTLPENKEIRMIFLSALIDAASKCSASPGHTAQPFQPSNTSIKYIEEAWNRDVWRYVSESAHQVSDKCSLKKGKVVIGDYSRCLSMLKEGDIVFADPPYSDVQYSRFYHVLETLAQGVRRDVSGVGRYPDQKFRPISNFSKRSKSLEAAKDLVTCCAQRGLTLILTFPVSTASNGLSSYDFLDFGRTYYPKVHHYEHDTYFSTLGGNGQNRDGRKLCQESVICFSFQ